VATLAAWPGGRGRELRFWLLLIEQPGLTAGMTRPGRPGGRCYQLVARSSLAVPGCAWSGCARVESLVCLCLVSLLSLLVLMVLERLVWLYGGYSPEPPTAGLVWRSRVSQGIRATRRKVEALAVLSRPELELSGGKRHAYKQGSSNGNSNTRTD
jgi:hypothetical protein